MPEPFVTPRVKVCGLTRAADVEAALGAGADALGFVHYAPSPRSMAAREIAALAEVLPDDVLSVAVLVDARPIDSLAFAREAGLRAVQLCGAESPDDWEGFALPILRRVGVDAQARGEIERWRHVAMAFVLDHPGAPGGSGLTVDLRLAARLAESAPCLLAGGLDEQQVARCVEAVRPSGVDASSRLESAPGIKDAGRVRQFVERALEALREVAT